MLLCTNIVVNNAGKVAPLSNDPHVINSNEEAKETLI